MDKLYKIPLGLIGLWLAILGLHGLYVHFNWLSLAFSGMHADMLFGAIDIPISLMSSQVDWMTNSSLQSWVLPGIICAAGVFLVYKFLLNK